MSIQNKVQVQGCVAASTCLIKLQGKIKAKRGKHVSPMQVPFHNQIVKEKMHAQNTRHTDESRCHYDSMWHHCAKADNTCVSQLEFIFSRVRNEGKFSICHDAPA